MIDEADWAVGGVAAVSFAWLSFLKKGFLLSLLTEDDGARPLGMLLPLLTEDDGSRRPPARLLPLLTEDDGSRFDVTGRLAAVNSFGAGTGATGGSATGGLLSRDRTWLLVGVVS